MGHAVRRLQTTNRTVPDCSMPIEPSAAGSFTDERKIVRQKNLVNILNRLNFQDKTILINFRHPKYNRIISLRAYPQPYQTNSLECRWHESAGSVDTIEQYEFQNLQINNGLNQILVEADLLDINKEKIRFQLPQHGYEVTARKVKRHLCEGNIYVQISQSGIVFYGLLTGFNAISFSVNIEMVPVSLLNRINPAATANIILKNECDVFYSGECEIIRLVCNQQRQSLALRPLTTHMQRFKAKANRTKRQVLSPSPNCIFKHPVTNRTVNLKIINLSSTGFLVEESRDNSMLLPGLLLRDVGIEYANNMIINADAQVLYRFEEPEGVVRCGLVILDMPVRDQIRISSLLQLGSYEHSYLCTTNIDLDGLWDFFFETGFVYPEKYSFIQGQKERFKKLYEKLYHESPEIARHIIYQDKGVIYGHVAMFRYYTKTWLLHHHAAKSSGHHKAGLVVMDHILNYINGFHRIPSANMRYIACYYQPKNRFASRVFGGSVRSFSDPRKCSIDDFGYFHYSSDEAGDSLSESWSLERAGYEDFLALEQRYREVSDGLLLEAFDLGPDPGQAENDARLSLNDVYQQLGFTRARHFFALKKQGVPYAILVINLADVGLNMSDLTNCIQVFVLEPEKLAPAELRKGLAQVSYFYAQWVFPVLIFPRNYADRQFMPYDKVYELAILDLENICPYLRYINGMINGQNIRKLDIANG